MVLLSNYNKHPGERVRHTFRAIQYCSQIAQITTGEGLTGGWVPVFSWYSEQGNMYTSIGQLLVSLDQNVPPSISQDCTQITVLSSPCPVGQGWPQLLSKALPPCGDH